MTSLTLHLKLEQQVSQDITCQQKLVFWTPQYKHYFSRSMTSFFLAFLLPICLGFLLATMSVVFFFLVITFFLGGDELPSVIAYILLQMCAQLKC